MKTEKAAKSVVIVARRWFQKTYGNTYHSCSVVVDGEPIGKAEFTYGYGEQYLQTAFAILRKAGYYAGDAQYHDMVDDMRNNRGKFVVTVSDVGRKQDL